jgi:hypothetical protein
MDKAEHEDLDYLEVLQSEGDLSNLGPWTSCTIVAQLQHVLDSNM